MTPDKIKKICRILHSRGREVTPDQVLEWLWEVSERLNKKSTHTYTPVHIANSILAGNKRLEMVMHIKFGDAL